MDRGATGVARPVPTVNADPPRESVMLPRGGSGQGVFGDACRTPRRSQLLSTAMAACYVLVMVWPFARDYFELDLAP